MAILAYLDMKTSQGNGITAFQLCGRKNIKTSHALHKVEVGLLRVGQQTSASGL